MKIIKPNIILERSLWKKGFEHVAGIDEAGKGPWAGPVAAACVIIHSHKQVVKGVRDSKIMTRTQREKAYEKIIKKSSAFGVGVISEKEIDRIGIQKAVRKAMKLALKNMQTKFNLKASYLIVDGSKTLPLRKNNARRILRGGLYHYSISAASVLAKVTRDRLMKKMSKKYLDYGFDKHVGYGTKLHMKNLLKYGLSPIHRKSFLPMKTILLPN